MRPDCRSCGAGLETLLDPGPQPVSNRYPAASDASEDLFPVALGACRACGQAQLSRTMPVAALSPRVDWIAYREPEGHLDALAEALARLPGVTPKSTFGAVTAKDDSLLDRLERKGFPRRWRLDPGADLGIGDPRAGLETIQDRLSGGARPARKADVLIARHVVEHAYDARRFVGALKEMLEPGGRIVFEAPDCARSFELRDLGAFWEEHVLYFTARTFRRFLGHVGLEVERFEAFPYPIEDSLVAVAKAGAPRLGAPAPAELEAELALARAFAASPGAERERFRALLGGRPREEVALFGAGHRSAMLLNILGLAGSVGAVIDDDPNKRGLFMPGSRLPIVGSDALRSGRLSLCLLNLSPESEAKVRERHRPFLESGGSFASVLPAAEARGR